MESTAIRLIGMMESFQDCCIGSWQWTGMWTKFSSIKNSWDILTAYLCEALDKDRHTSSSLHCIAMRWVPLLFPFYEWGNRLREVLCPVTHSWAAAAPSWHSKGAKCYLVGSDWNSIPLIAAGGCWRKVKIHLIHQPEAGWLPPGPLCAVVLIPVGCPPTPDTNFIQLSSPWLLWASEKKSALGWFTAPCSDLLSVFVP